MKLLSIFIFISSTLMAQHATDLMRQSQQRTSAGDSEMKSTIDIFDARGNQRIREITTFTRKTKENSELLIRFTAPAEVRGTTILVYDYPDKADQQWVYLPATGKVRQLVSNEKGKNFMGSEFTNADMSQLNLDDYSFTDLGSVTYNGTSCKKIEAKGKTAALQNEQGYSKKIILIDASRLIPLREELYDRNGKPHRELLYENYKQTPGGKWVAWKMTMNNLQNGRRSIMTVDQFVSDLTQPAHLFSPNALGK
jgi:outer membrane lipoprotein-sorting protein